MEKDQKQPMRQIIVLKQNKSSWFLKFHAHDLNAYGGMFLEMVYKLEVHYQMNESYSY